jgi:hypothetical protein
MNGILGVPFRFHYQAAGNASGLTNIRAKVRSPSGSYFGIFTLVEMADPDFFGVYYFDLITSATGEEGEYSIIIVEGLNGIREPSRVSFHHDLPKSLGPHKHDINGKIDHNSEVKGIVGKLSVDLTGVVKGRILIAKEVLE